MMDQCLCDPSVMVHSLAEDPRDEIQGGQWRGVVGGIHFAGEALAGGYSRSLVRNQKTHGNWRKSLEIQR